MLIGLLVATEVRFGSNAEVAARNSDVRFPPDSDQSADIKEGPFRPRYVPHAASTAPVLKLVKASKTGATRIP